MNSGVSILRRLSGLQDQLNRAFDDFCRGAGKYASPLVSS